MAGTYNNQQGKTVRNMGHTIDFSKPDYFTNDEYTQHVYMILGRATCLEWSLFRNLPMLEDGSDIDFTVFEHGPPGYIAEFLKRLEDWCESVKTTTSCLGWLLHSCSCIQRKFT